MKLKFVLTAFAAVAMFAACTEQAILDETGVVDPNNGELIAGATTVTFVLKLVQPTTKVAADYDPESTVGGAAAFERYINPDDVRLVIFNDADALEINQQFSSGTIYNIDNTATIPVATTTVLVTAGQKKIFVFANANTIQHSSTETFEDLMDTFGGDLTAFYALCFNAGIPQEYYTRPISGGSDRTFDLSPLYNQVTDGGTGFYGLPASNNNAITYQLIANIDASVSNTGTASVTGTSATNTFAIDLQFMLAKARLTFSGSSTATTMTYAISGTTIAEIRNLKYAVHNLAKFTSYIQTVSGTTARSWYHNAITGLTPSYDYLGNFDDASNVNVPLQPNGAVNKGPFLYVPENTSGYMTRGQVPYYAINANYVPAAVVGSIGFNPALSNPITYNTMLDLTDDITYDPATPGSKTYFYLLKDITGTNGTITAGTCFRTLNLLQQAAWLAVYGTNVAGGGWTVGTSPDAGQTTDLITLGVIKNPAPGSPDVTPPATPPTVGGILPYPFNDETNYMYYQFADSESWYRWEVGTGTSVWPKYGALRGYAYDANITEIKGPGKPYKWMLDENDPDPVEAYTYVTVTVEILDWILASKDGILQ